MTPTTQLHASYCRLSGLHLGPANFNDEYLWSQWAKHGWTEQDLFVVVRHLQRQYPKYALKMLRLERLIDPQTFRGYLAEALAMQRNARPAPDARMKALEATGRPAEEQQDNVRLGGDVAKKLCDAMRKAIE